MPADHLAHAFHAAKIDLPLGNLNPLSGRRNRSADHGGDSVLQPGKISLGQIRQAVSESGHIIAQHKTERCVQSRSESGIKHRRDIAERIARQQQLDPVNMRAFMDKFLSERP